MDSKTSEIKLPTSAETKTVIIPRLPQEIIHEILDCLAVTNPDFNPRLLQSCALVSKSWVPLCRRHLFHTILFTSKDITRWLEAFPVPEESPAHHVRVLRFSVAEFNTVPEKFFEYTPWFTNVVGVTLLAYGVTQPSWGPPYWRLPQSVTSLTIGANTITLPQIQDIMAQLPNLDDLTLSGSLVGEVKGAVVGDGTGLRGKFGGQLRLLGRSASEGVVDMLLGIPTGLHFTHVQIRSPHECLPSTARLVDACAKTLVKLLYTVDGHYGCDPFPQSFDFSKLPNLQEVDFRIGWMGGGLLWIPEVLSTLRPATSPRLSTIQLNFTRPYIASRSVEAAIKATGDDLRWVADEIARIEREFGGAVEVNVCLDSSFEAVSDVLNVRVHFYGVGDTS